jgi:SAM-dependent methyltransferase
MPQFQHAMLVEETHDERARHNFIASLREFTMANLYPRLRTHYREVLAPRHAEQHGELPQSVDRVRRVLEASPLYIGYSLLVRGTQELLWDTVGEVVERQLPALIERAADATSAPRAGTSREPAASGQAPSVGAANNGAASDGGASDHAASDGAARDHAASGEAASDGAASNRAASDGAANDLAASGGAAGPVAGAATARGSLALDPLLPVPDYTAAVDIHVMPGGFHTELTEDDVFAGALYDRGVHLFAFGGLGPLNDELGVATAAAVRLQFPDFAPRKVLDLGCGAGHATLPLADAFPASEVHGADLAAPMLRYAAARAAALGYSIHFAQQDATHTNYAEGSFDLIASTLLLHEMPRPAILALLRECHRLLRPGGVMVHHDLLRWPEDPFDAFMMAWTTRHNNEPYERASGTLNFPEDCAAAGFDAADVFIVAQPGAYLEEVYQVSGIRGARKR